MEPTLSSVYWGVCTDRVTSGTLESAMMYFKPQEVLTAGELSTAAAKLVTAYVSTSSGAMQEAVPALPSSPAVLQQVFARLLTQSVPLYHAIVATVALLVQS